MRHFNHLFANCSFLSFFFKLNMQVWIKESVETPEVKGAVLYHRVIINRHS